MKQLFILFSLFISCSLNAQYQFIPQPKQIDLKRGQFIVPEIIWLSENLPKQETEYFKNQLKNDYQFDKSAADFLIDYIKTSEFQNVEAYKIEILPDKINISSGTDEGYFRAVQTLVQLFREHSADKKFACMTITDEPKFKWRGMHLDVVRHFFTVEEVKKYLDYLAFYKINTFHWHLTDDQGWRIEIKKYPKLTETGSRRKESMTGPYVDNQFDDTPYDGFYTQDEIKEVVEYAKKLHITVVPEIEMPGHALAALAAYPDFSCTGGPFEVETKWGVFDDIFCPKEETFEFLENVLDEVIALFPSEYIHIGGDEAPKTRWKECPHCQELIKKERLKDEHGLQSYFIKRIEKYVNSKGRKIIGWNEILEGGLAPNAAVMSWTGEDGGIEAARTGHFAVMTPGGYCYFDHYQGDPQNEPLAFGGFTPLDKIYSYNPIPKELNPEESKYILGIQANLWTEYIPDFKQVEYMLFPRLMALSEVGWGTSDPEKYTDFENRVIKHFDFLNERSINFSKSIYNLNGKVIRSGNGIAYELYSSRNPNNIRYTTNGAEPVTNSSIYETAIPVTESMTIKAAYIENNEIKSAVMQQEFRISKSTGKKIELEFEPSPNYSFNGNLTLVDGITGNPKVLGKTWLGFNGKDVIATIDLGQKTKFSEVSVNMLENKGSWIHLGKRIEIYRSDDNLNFKTIAKMGHGGILQHNGQIKVNVGKQNSRYIRVHISNAGIIPAGNPGAGSPAWLFVDEIGVW